MHSGIELVDKIDKLIKEKGISRRQLCADVGISNSTIATWKTKNILPTAELIGKVAKELNVSVDWLLNGNDTEPPNKDDKYHRENIFNRIKILLQERCHHEVHEVRELFNIYLSDIISFDIILNWRLYRIDISEEILIKIANEIDIDVQYILTGESNNEYTFNPHLYKLAQQNEHLLRCLHNANETDLKFFNEYFNMKMWYQDYMRQRKKEEDSKLNMS